MKCLTIAALLLFSTMAVAVDFEKKIPLFAFGGVGFAGVPSKGQDKFTQILASCDSLAELKKWFESGSDEAKMYCLVGFYYLDQKHFKTAVKSDTWKGKKIAMAHGCIISEQKRSAVISQIKKGAYAMYVPKSKWENPPEEK